MEYQTNSDSLTSQSTQNLIFVDSKVDEYQDLLSATSSEADLVLLDPYKDGISQISQELAQHQDIEAVYIFGQENSNGMNLGNTTLNLDTIDGYVDELQGWSNALTEEGDILLYGYGASNNQDTTTIANQLANITDADIAISHNSFGDNLYQEEWEVKTGAIEATLDFGTDLTVEYSMSQPMSETQDMSNNISEMVHNMDDMGSHNPLSHLAPHSEATHIAVKNGRWFNSNTWKNGQIPDDGADVLIPKGVTIRYNGTSEDRLDTLRVDGVLNFATKRDTQIMVDTFVVSPEGKLNIGKGNSPVSANNTAKIIFTSDDAIDKSSDPTQLGKGLISHGRVGIYGAEKLDFVKIEGDALAGENELVLNLPNGANSPAGWQVGDQLVLGGTYYRGSGSNEDNTKFHDEELTITAINGDRISFTNNHINKGDNTVLRFDHQRPKGFENRVNLYVANTTRNVVFETENGENVPIANRGHVMFMHNPNVVVKNAGFYNLGRTDKNKLIDDPKQNADGSVGKGSNVRGRYSLHFHRTGADNLNGKAAIAKGNAVVGSPGWGIAHHDSHANLEDNVVFDVVGAAIAAEAGNEIGTWRNNITIKTIGDNDNNPDLSPTSPRVNRFDFGFNGEAYWVQGAGQIDIVDNIAVSAEEVGIMHYGGSDGGQDARDAQTIPVANLPEKWRSIARGTEDETVIDVAAVPLKRISGFEAYNSKRGIGFWGSLKNTDAQLGIDGIPTSKGANHDFYSEVDDFTVWNIRGVGVSITYSSQVELDGGLILGNNRPGSLTRSASFTGVSGNFGANKSRFKNLEIDGFEVGFNVPADWHRDYASSSITNSTLRNNGQNIAPRKFNSRQYTDYSPFFEIDRSNSFEIPGDNALPTPKFNTEAIGGLAVKLDGSSSFDKDSSERSFVSKGITSYGWDLNNDGNIDQYGRYISHYFDKPGSHEISLTVWDNQGANSTISKTVNVAPSSYKNLIINGDFGGTRAFGRQHDPTWLNAGWMTGNTVFSVDSNYNNGAAVSSRNGDGRLGQIILDNSMRRGNQTLSIDLKNTEGNSRSNEITVTVWGVDGEFNNPGWTLEGPQSIGSKQINREKLLQKTVGGSSFDWTTFNWDLNFGNGHQFVVFQVNYDGVLTTDKDFVGIDNVKIK